MTFLFFNMKLIILDFFQPKPPFLIGIHSMQHWTATTRHRVKKKKHKMVSVNSRLKATQIVGERKVFHRQSIPGSSYARKDTVKVRPKPSKTILCYLLHQKPFENDGKCFLFHLKNSSFSRYLSFYYDFLVLQKNGLIRKIRLTAN